MKTLFVLLLLAPAPALRAEPPVAKAVKSAQMSYLRGMLLERRGSYAEALASYEEALTHDPDSAFIAREAAELALEMGAADKALRWALRVLELEPKSAGAHVLLGRVHWARGDNKAAEAAFEEALKLDPRSSESIFSLGNLLSTHSLERARALLQKFLDQNPAHAAEAHFQIAKLDLQGGKLKSAQEHLKAAIALEPDSESLPARYSLAQAYEMEQSTDAALGAYLDILRLEPHNTSLLTHIGQIYFMKGRWEEAKAKFEAARSLQPNDPAANQWLAQFAERQGDFAKAAEYLKASASLAEDPSLSLRLSYYLTQANALKEAVRVLESAVERWPNNDQILYFLALGYDDLKDVAPAVKLLRKVAGLKPDWREARYQLAVLLEKQGDIAEAEKEFRALLAARPDDASVLNYLGYSLADRGLKLAEAEPMIRRATALDPANGAYADSLGWVHFKQGRSTEAVKELQGAILLLPEDETVWDHLGDAYEAVGSSAAAWRAWKKAGALNPSDARVPGKADRLEARFSEGELGGLYLEHLEGLQGGLRKLSGLCDLKATILGRSFSFQCLATYRFPDELDIDLLGPVFTPMFRIRLNAQGFAMDPVRVEGLDQKAMLDAAYAAFSAIRDYLSGRLFSLRPARYKRGWRSRQVSVPGWRLDLSPDGLMAVGLRPESPPEHRVTLEEWGRWKGRHIPRRIQVSGKGFSLTLRFDDVKIEVQGPTQ